MSKNMEAMGKNLADASTQVIEEEREQNTMNECPVCHQGRLRVMFGKDIPDISFLRCLP
jgi:Zn finger protein HypA/HybF involved in hydrogenase expression